MFRNLNREEHFSGRTSESSHAGHGVSPLGHGSQESSWISVFSVVSRPAMSFLQKYLPGRPRPALSDSVPGWVNGDLKHNFIDEGRGFFGHVGEKIPTTQHSADHLSFLHCQHDGAAGLGDSHSESTLRWLTADSLRELGIQNAAELEINVRQQSQLGYLASMRSFLSQILISSASAQEMNQTNGGHIHGKNNWSTDASSSPPKNASSGRNWWSEFWGSEEGSQSWLSNISMSGVVITSGHCPQPENGTKATVVEPTELFVQVSDRDSMSDESPGPSTDKEEPIDNGSLHIDRPESLPNSEWLTLEDQLRVGVDCDLVSAGAATVCNEVAVLTPDQDNGYSSLEEEHGIYRPDMIKASPNTAETKEGARTPESEAGGEILHSIEEEEQEPRTTGVMEEETEDSDSSDLEEAEDPDQDDQSVVALPITMPSCENKAIAYIMGSPCSDDDSESDGEHSDGDDDGFDSEGSSEFSDSVDEDDEEDSDSDDEVDSEAERLWNSLCQSRDPYSPRNFTARIHTTSTPPQTVPSRNASVAAAPCSPQASPASPPDHLPSPLSCSPASPPSPSPLRDSDTWDDSTSASEVDEGESLRLWNSFSASADPYSPLNFQATIRTQEPTKVGHGAASRARKSSRAQCRPPRHAAAASPPEYREEDAEERLDSGFSETLPHAAEATSTTAPAKASCALVKKVRFCEEVEEFFASCGEEEEDRRGPWEELARDRCRFLRRCQEVEESIGYCLEPRHRSAVYLRLAACCVESS